MVQEDVGQGHHREDCSRLQGHLQASPGRQSSISLRIALFRG